MRLQVVILYLLMMWTTACRAPESSQDQDGIKKERLAHKILHKVAAQLKEKTGLRPIGTIGQMLHDVERLGLSFTCYKPIDIVEARKLLVQAVNAMLDEINQEKQIRPYLCRYPFLPRNIEIEILLRNPDGTGVAPGNLWMVQAEGGCLEYRVDSPSTKRLVTIYKETFNEALERLADPSLPLAAFEPDPPVSQEELKRLRKGISLVSEDGSIWHLGENGSWILGTQCTKSRYTAPGLKL